MYLGRLSPKTYLRHACVAWTALLIQTLRVAGLLQKHMGTAYDDVNKALHRFAYHGKAWAKAVGEELNIKDMYLQQ